MKDPNEINVVDAEVVKTKIQISELEYWKGLAKCLEDVEKESPCDPDITEDQIAAYQRLNSFKSNFFY